ncbi:class I SAM-dependent methyltransferase [Pseudomonadota bacterium]
MLIRNEPLAGKTVLEVGSGLGRTTRNLASGLSDHPGTNLIVTDVTDRYFDQIRNSLGPADIKPQFIQTDACDLAGIEPESIDYIVCNFALCEINSDIGRGTLALAKFLLVLKPGGKLFVEEEMPISEANSAAQNTWSLIWRVLKSAQTLTQHKTATNEYHPVVLSEICKIVGFTDVKWEASSRTHPLAWLEPRIDLLASHMHGFPSPQIKQMFVHLANDVKNRAKEAGKIEIPIYKLSAVK